jgi:hypothetical protein
MSTTADEEMEAAFMTRLRLQELFFWFEVSSTISTTPDAPTKWPVDVRFGH